MNTDIKIGVSLYSLSTEFIHGKRNLEGCLKAVHDMGYKGIEIVAAQMVPEYPFPSDEWLYHYEEIIPKLVSYGYKGYIASEFEGHHFYSDVDCIEQLGNYVAMNKAILENLS